MARLIILSIIQSLLLCGGQIMLKMAVAAMDKSQSVWAFLVHSLLLNWWLLACGILMGSAGLLWMYILRHFPFSNAYPLTALSFVFGTLAAIVFLHETVDGLHWLGLILILIGCYFVAR